MTTDVNANVNINLNGGGAPPPPPPPPPQPVQMDWNFGPNKMLKVIALIIHLIWVVTGGVAIGSDNSFSANFVWNIIILICLIVGLLNRIPILYIVVLILDIIAIIGIFIIIGIIGYWLNHAYIPRENRAIAITALVLVIIDLFLAGAQAYVCFLVYKRGG